MPPRACSAKCGEVYDTVAAVILFGTATIRSCALLSLTLAPHSGASARLAKRFEGCLSVDCPKSSYRCICLVAHIVITAYSRI